MMCCRNSGFQRGRTGRYQGVGALASALEYVLLRVPCRWISQVICTTKKIMPKHIGLYRWLCIPLTGVYKGPRSTPPEAKVSTKNHYETMNIKVPEAEILPTPTKIERLSLWNRT